MNKKLFVGNLSYDVKSEQLQELFATVGKVLSANVIIEKMSGRSKGFGFVEMETEEEAQMAIQALNGKEFQGRAVIVSEAKPMEPRTSGSRDGGFGGNRSFGSNSRFGGRDSGRSRY